LKIRAHFRRFFPKAPETGLSAPILYAPGGAYKYFRFNPLRGGVPALFPAESAALFAVRSNCRPPFFLFFF
jgi:hypothetical protein